MKAHFALGLTLIGVSAVVGSSHTYAQASDQENVHEVAQVDPSVDAVRRELEKARIAVEDARKVAEQIVADAQREANRIKKNSVVNDGPADLGPAEMQTHKIAVEIASGTVEEIATAIMPSDWRIQVDVKDVAVLQRRFQFVSTKSRDQALRDLLLPVGLKHQYFYDLQDEAGYGSPLLVISKR